MKEFIDKLIERLEEASRNMMPVIPTEEAINIVKQLAEEYKGGWIACSDRLPEPGKAVLTCDKDCWISVNINTPYNGKKNDFECGYYVAWMPLPAPHTEVEQP